MSNFVKQVLLQCHSPINQSKRFRGKINIQRPQKPHYERARLIAATQPILPEKPKTSTCFMSYKERMNITQDNPYDAIIAREVLNWLEHSRTVGIFHMNSITQSELFPVRVALHKQNMHLKSYGKKIIQMGVQNTRFEAILPLFDSSHCMVFSPDLCVAPLLRITKKVRQLVPLAGIVEGRLLSRNELVQVAQLPSLPLVQAELVSTINMAACNLVKQLETHQNNFVNVLDVYAKSADAAQDDNKTEAKDPLETPEALDSKAT